MRSTFNRRQVLAAAATVAAGTAITLRPGAAKAAIVLPPNFTYTDLVSRINTHLVPPEGGEPVLITTRGLFASWSPDGSRLIRLTQAGVESVRADGTRSVKIFDPITGSVVHSPDGRWIVFNHGQGLSWAWSDGSGLIGELFPGSTAYDGSPCLSRDSVVLFERYLGDTYSVYTSALTGTGWSTPVLLVPNARQPQLSPDGTKIAYVSVDSRNIDTGIVIADADGSNPVRISPDAFPGFHHLCWSPDGRHIYYDRTTISPEAVERLPVTGGTAPEIVVNGFITGFRPMTSRSKVTRVWGELALDTAIAVSQSRWATAADSTDTRARAQAVVLSRGDAFYDALAGSALAANKNAPLLITPPTGLYSRAEDEIKRVLAPGGVVYVLGGIDVVPKAIEDRIKVLGYQAKRLAGEMMYETAIAINDEITTSPDTVFIATGVEYYDALAAGAAAGSGQWGNAVVILTDGNRMPASSAEYLDNLDPTRVAIVLAGGPGAEALLDDAWRGGKLPSWPDTIDIFDCTGETAVETALLIAWITFFSPTNAAIATTSGWYDALTGGAMIGSRRGPLLLTQPTGLNANVAGYLSDTSASLQTAYILGGTAALPQHLVAPIGDRVGVPGRWDYGQIVPGYQGSLAVKTAAPQAEATTGPTPPIDRSRSDLLKKATR